MTRTSLAIEPRGDQDHSAARKTDQRQFRSGLFLSGLAHTAILVLLFLLWQQPADEPVPLPPIPVTVIHEQEGQSGAAGNGNDDTAASASDTQSQEAATENPAQTAPATAQEEQPEPAETQPTPTQPTVEPTPPTPTPSLPQSKVALEQAPPLPPEPVPPRKPAPPRPKPKVVEQTPPTPPVPSPPAPQTAEASPIPTPSGAVQGTNAALPAGVGGQGRGDTGKGLAEVGNGAANGTADDYLGLVRRWILRFAKTPKDDCSREHGDGRMDVTFHRDGTVVDVQITQSSGCPASDAEAVRMVRAASPLPPIPDRYTGDPKTMGLPFDFRPGFFDRIFHRD